MSRLIKTAAASIPVAPAQRLWQELEIARSRPPGAVRAGGPTAVPAAAAPYEEEADTAAAQPAAPEDAAPVPEPGGTPAQQAGALDAGLLEQRLKEEYHRGYQAGREDGARETLARVEEAVRAEITVLEAELKAFIEEERAYRARCEQGLLDLALAVAGRVVRDAIAADPAALLPLVAEAAGRAGDDRIRARAHPREAEVLAATAQEGGPLAHLEVEADPTLEPGDVILESPRGRYDLRPAVLLERVRRRLEAEVDPA